MTTKVKLRQKPISGNRQSLYLDFYPPIEHPESGKLTRREFLGFYIFTDRDEVKKEIKQKKLKGECTQKQEALLKTIKPLNQNEKGHNNNVLQLAEQIRDKRNNELNKPEIYTGYEKEQLKIREQGEKNFVEYFKTLADKRKASNHDNWISSYHYLNTFTKGSLRFADLNEKFCNDFKEYLLTTKSNKSRKAKLSQNTAVSYFNKLKAALKQAYKDGYLQNNLNAKIESIKEEETIKITLTLEELNILAKAECDNPILKKVVLFFAITGIPFKELQNLTWEQIEVSETFGIRVKSRRQKSKKPFYTYISEQAYNILGERKESTDKVFEGLNDRDRYHDFKLWLIESGIKKKMTFHDLRHTYGCLQIDLGTDLYTLQGNLGHSTSKQTETYAKISSQLKREAADKIKLDM